MINATNQTAAMGGDGASLAIQCHSTEPIVEEMEIPIHSIQTEGTQTRVNGLNPETVAAYAEAMKAGASFPSPVVYADGTTNTDGTTNFWLADGAHRLAAAKQNRCNYIKCEVRNGGQRGALQWALLANAKHGLQRTNEDKRFAVELALDDPIWSTWSGREIAKLCGVSNWLVSDVIRVRRGEVLDSNSREPVESDSVEESETTGLLDSNTHEHRVSADADEPANVQRVELSDDLSDDADEFDTAKFDEAKEMKIKAPVMNGAPVVDSLLVKRILANLSELARQLWKLDKGGLYQKHAKTLSAVIEDVRAKGGMKPLPVAGPAPVEQPVPF